MTDFSQMQLATPVLNALIKTGYTTPTPIQMQAIPAALEGHDVMGIAQTGTGKTAAFALPILNHLAGQTRMPPRKGTRALILAPTRELASQIAKSFITYGKEIRPVVETVFGGVKITTQIKKMIAGTDILVATPGRLLDLIDRNALTLNEVEFLVLDEADQMMDMGFIHSLRKIAKLLPKERQTMFFSATMPKAIKDLAQQFLNDPVHVSVTPESTTAERVAQFAYAATPAEKPGLTAHHLNDQTIGQALIFTRTKHGADRLAKRLHRYGHVAVAIHGNKSQSQREKALGAFRKGDSRVLIATDIAARGIDISGITHVFNYELPNVPEQYVHRIGRSGRAGASGTAISFVAGDEKSYLKQIEKVTGQKIPLAPHGVDLSQLKEVDIVEEVKAAEPKADRKPRGSRNRRTFSDSNDRPRRNGQDYRPAAAPMKDGDSTPWTEEKPRGQKPRRAAEGRQDRESFSKSDRPARRNGPRTDDRGNKRFEKRSDDRAEGRKNTRQDRPRTDGPRKERKWEDRPSQGTRAERPARQERSDRRDYSETSDRPAKRTYSGPKGNGPKKPFAGKDGAAKTSRSGTSDQRTPAGRPFKGKPGQARPAAKSGARPQGKPTQGKPSYGKSQPGKSAQRTKPTGSSPRQRRA